MKCVGKGFVLLLLCAASVASVSVQEDGTIVTWGTGHGSGPPNKRVILELLE